MLRNQKTETNAKGYSGEQNELGSHGIKSKHLVRVGKTKKKERGHKGLEEDGCLSALAPDSGGEKSHGLVVSKTVYRPITKGQRSSKNRTKTG